MKIEFLNHAAVVLHVDGARLLADPWFEGTCFKKGWGLQYDNPQAYDRAAVCSHLWISHFHGDHFHPRTLQKLAKKAPNLAVLANKSANFSMVEPLRQLGFRFVAPFRERRTQQLSESVRVVRYPTSGIDNMLVVESNEWRVLNYNDCNLPSSALRRLCDKIGPVDVLLVNFNHAGKLLESPLRAPEEIKQSNVAIFRDVVGIVDPTWVVPFASHHYYRAPEMQEQNSSLLTNEELATYDSRVVPLRVGQAAEFGRGAQPEITDASEGVTPAPRSIVVYERSASDSELLQAAGAFLASIRRQFFGLAGWVPQMRVLVKDLQSVLTLEPGRAPALQPVSDQVDAAHIAAHSEALLGWFQAAYGTDSFSVSGYFDIVSPDTRPIAKFLLAGLLEENGVSPRDMLRIGVTKSGVGFLLNRREELWAILRARGLRAGYRR